MSCFDGFGFWIVETEEGGDGAELVSGSVK